MQRPHAGLKKRGCVPIMVDEIALIRGQHSFVGFASNHDCAVYPLPDNSIKRITDAFGFDCHANVSARNCQKNASLARVIIITLGFTCTSQRGSVFVRDPDKPISCFSDTNL